MRFHKTLKRRISGIIVAALAASTASLAADSAVQPTQTFEELSKRKLHHQADGTFFNPWCDECRRGMLDFLYWKLVSTNRHAEQKKRPIAFQVHRPGFAALEAGEKDYTVWLGHSTVLIRANGIRILTDPVFGDINFLLKRKTALPIGSPEDLPAIHYVVISHNHYDHLDIASIRLLKKLFDPRFVTGPGYAGFFKTITDKHTTLDWWEAHEAEGVRITSLPAQHWSRRGVFDTNKMLWASYLVEGKGKRYFWAGDTGYFAAFREYGEKFGPFDAAFLPIGSYEPRWFMGVNHLNPEEALKTAVELRARIFIPIHWGTFDLTDEPLYLPIERLKEAAKDAPNKPRLKILDHGGWTTFE
ncbi:MAG: MBL fold metallo-hydrolase [Deltaproteobacteria bacterium]|nr:MBL fold metallo-hydrolase [Deltaproteobacteria bacterium]